MAQMFAYAEPASRVTRRATDSLLVSLTSTELTAIPGGTATAVAIVGPPELAPGVRFTVETPPAGITLLSARNFGSTCKLVLHVAPSVAAGTYPLLVRATTRVATRKIAVTLVVTLFDLLLDPAAVVVLEQGAVVTVRVLRAPGFVAPVSLHLDDRGPVQGTFVPSPTLADSSLVLSARASMIGPRLLAVTGTSGGHRRTAMLKVLPILAK
jgi:hypothetical protein